MQIELLDAFVTAVQGESTASELDEILARIQDFSRAHFLSEELLMRLHAYTGYADHLEDHDRMIEMVAELRQRIDSNDFQAALSQAAALRQKFVQHIHDRDQRLEQELEGSG
jgi:hemerythrin